MNHKQQKDFLLHLKAGGSVWRFVAKNPAANITYPEALALANEYRKARRAPPARRGGGGQLKRLVGEHIQSWLLDGGTLQEFCCKFGFTLSHVSKEAQKLPIVKVWIFESEHRAIKKARGTRKVRA